MTACGLSLCMLQGSTSRQRKAGAFECVGRMAAQHRGKTSGGSTRRRVSTKSRSAITPAIGFADHAALCARCLWSLLDPVGSGGAPHRAWRPALRAIAGQQSDGIGEAAAIEEHDKIDESPPLPHGWQLKTPFAGLIDNRSEARPLPPSQQPESADPFVALPAKRNAGG